MMEHQDVVDNQFLERYLLDELGPSERDSFEAHLFDCVHCAEAMRAAAIFKDEAGAMLGPAVQRPTGAAAAGTGLPGGGPLRKFLDWIRVPVLAPALAGLLLCVVAYQNLVQIPGLREPRIVPAFSLVPVTRGDDQVLRFPNGARSVVLTIDLTVPSPTGYTLEFTSDAGRKWLTLNEIPPAGSDTLSVQLDAVRVPLGRHLLSVRPSGGGDELMRFRFVMEKQ